MGTALHQPPPPAHDCACGSTDQDDPEPPAGPTLLLEDTTGSLTPPSRDAVLAWSSKAAQAAGAEHGEVRVRLLSDAAMAQAHEAHLGDPSVTDVITFDLADGAAAHGAPLDVDVLVCLDEARRQSTQRGHQVELELVLYILHGILHCVGFDDHTESDARTMHTREDEILTFIGLSAAYGPFETHNGDTE